MTDKKDLRTAFSEKRILLSANEAGRLSQRIELKAAGLDAYQNAGTVAFYHPVRNEVSSWGLFHRSRLRGQRTFFPKIRDRSIAFIECLQKEDFTAGRFGIPEPRGEGVSPPAELDLIFVPGLVFDLGGFRVGYGQGYYDRFLSGFEGVSVGLAYDFQVVTTLPRQGGDVPLNFVVTETRIIGRMS